MIIMIIVIIMVMIIMINTDTMIVCPPLCFGATVGCVLPDFNLLQVYDFCPKGRSS